MSEETVRVRMVETFYRNRLEWEDGPGSRQNVVSDATESHRILGRMPVSEAESLTRSELEYDYGFYFEEDSWNGREEYSYALQYFDPARREWRYLKSV